MQEVKIGTYKIGSGNPPFIVAELSANHNGSLKRALKTIEAAKKAGAHAIKFQTYTADTITLNSRTKEFLITNKKSLWYGKNLYDLYQEAHTPWEWHKTLFDHAHKLGLTAFSTPFDETAVDFLETLQVPCYKIGSPEIVDLPLIKKVAATKKPLILSTGGATLAEIKEAVQTARKAGCKQLVLLKCTAAYPTQPKDCHLRTLPDLARRFKVPVGLSDHTLGTCIPIASVSLGAVFIEKHFTLSRSDGCVDSAFSLEPDELKALVDETRKAWEALGEVHYGPLPAEKTTLSHRPSLFFAQDLKAGCIVKPENVVSLRPALGLPPKECDAVCGLKLRVAVKKGTPVTWKYFS